MSKSLVYHTDLHTTPNQNLLSKLELLITKAGIKEIDFQKRLTALKIHFGEPGNLAFIRPNYVSVVVKIVREMKGIPFLTDANTLYKGRRSNAVDHLQSAMENGFSPLTVGCNIIIADGLKGTDYKEIEINQKHCKTAKIADAIAKSDVIISLNHFKGHEMAGFGGALKNIGMGSGSIGGKLEMHSDSKPYIVQENCTGCEVCVNNCGFDAIHLNDENIASIDYSICSGCGQCIAVCQYDAPQAKLNASGMQEKIMEYAFAVLKDKPAFHINFVMDVSPYCDCWNYNDIPIIPDLGILASFDPVALDLASVDLVNKSQVNPASAIGNLKGNNNDLFNLVFPNIDWRIGIDYAEKIGLGTKDYEIVYVK